MLSIPLGIFQLKCSEIIRSGEKRSHELAKRKDIFIAGRPSELTFPSLNLAVSGVPFKEGRQGRFNQFWETTKRQRSSHHEEPSAFVRGRPELGAEDLELLKQIVRPQWNGFFPPTEATARG